jgi:CRP/FNR family transcriptional regulator
VAADEETTVLFIAKHDVRRLCIQHPALALAALKVLAGRLRQCADLVAALGLREVGQRLARLLLAEARRKGVRSAPGLRVHLTLTHQQIASRIGTVREVVSRTLTRLQQDGLLIVEGHQLLIPDEQALAAFAGEG